MQSFTPVASTIGGVLIGLSVSALLIFTGRIGGISGVLGQAFLPEDGERRWRVLFIGGLVVGGLVLQAVAPSTFDTAPTASPALLALAGLLVGFGTRLAGGCTSGHGICGIARLSPRSIVATVTFMASAGATVFIVHHLMGGPS